MDRCPQRLPGVIRHGHVSSTASSVLRTSIWPAPARKTPNTNASESSGTRALTSCLVQPLLEVVGRRHGVRGGGVQRLGPLRQQHRPGAPLQVPADVGHDADQPAGEPVRIPQPVQRDERLQERLLHDVVHVAAVVAEADGTGTRHRLVPLDQQPERDRVAIAGEPDQVTVGDVHGRRSGAEGQFR
jgi:hypothetical protein